MCHVMSQKMRLISKEEDKKRRSLNNEPELLATLYLPIYILIGDWKTNPQNRPHLK